MFLRGVGVKLSTETFTRHKDAVSVIKEKYANTEKGLCREKQKGFTTFHNMFFFVFFMYFIWQISNTEAIKMSSMYIRQNNALD